MQYLLTEEEYNTLHGESDSEVDELETKILHLEAELKKAQALNSGSFKDEVTDMLKEANSNIFLAPELMGAEVLELQIRMDYLPPNLKNYIRNIVRTH
jgi:hypothetical protein